MLLLPAADVHPAPESDETQARETTDRAARDLGRVVGLFYLGTGAGRIGSADGIVCGSGSVRGGLEVLDLEHSGQFRDGDYTIWTSRGLAHLDEFSQEL